MNLPRSLCFIDVETTGVNALYGRIIEIGLLKVTDGKLVKEYRTLLNPRMYLDPFIESMTGIHPDDLEKAPYFEDIADELSYLLEDSIFVAHNARFDYGFIRSEFKRMGRKYRSPHMCTVKLARLLYPNQKKYNLDSIIEKFNLECKNRHRAFDDAKVLYEFYNIAQKEIKEELFEQAVNIVLKKPALPSSLPSDLVDNLPESPGVYIFYGEDGVVLYIGKSVNIRDRVLSHFSNDHLSSTDMKISQQIKSIETIETAGELGALLLESTLIKKHQPLFNRMLREARKMPVLLKRVNPDGFNTIEIVELDETPIEEVENILGVFRTTKQTKEFLYNVAKEFKLCPRLLGLDKGKGVCFYYHLGQCLGACGKKENLLKYNLRFDEGFYNKKIRPWRFDKPVIIKESGDREELHLVDKWCYLGSIKNEGEFLDEIKYEYRFDYDTYKILNRFLMDPKNEAKIKVLSN
jgi:DNA polymerase III subunit epsilon